MLSCCLNISLMREFMDIRILNAGLVGGAVTGDLEIDETLN